VRACACVRVCVHVRVCVRVRACERVAPAGGATAEGVRSQARRHSPPPPRGGRL
jgi:hypothetical protein